MLNSVYDPLVEAARTNAENGHALLEQVGEKLWQANPGCCRSVTDGVRLAKVNLSLYAHFYPRDVADTVRVYYGLYGLG